MNCWLWNEPTWYTDRYYGDVEVTWSSTSAAICRVASVCVGLILDLEAEAG